MRGTGDKGGRTAQKRDVDGVTATDRTRVIMLSQVVMIVALLILWWVLRARRSEADA
jgi:hypothetical protein